jgi:UDP-glucose 4-epimerase
MFGSGEVQIKELGFRHGEKLFESLLSVEERVSAEDLGDYFRVPMDSRDLNYEEYFSEGISRNSSLEAYTSHNARRLTDSELIELLNSLPEISRELGK